MNWRMGRSATIEDTAEATRSVGGGDAFCMPPDKETPRCPISETSVDSSSLPSFTPTVGYFAPCRSSCLASPHALFPFILYSLWISLSFFPSLPLYAVCSCFASFPSMAPSRARKRVPLTHQWNRANERIYRAITRMNRVTIVYQRWKKVNVLLPPRGSFERCENFTNYERKNMHGHGTILSRWLFPLFPLHASECKMLDESYTFFDKDRVMQMQILFSFLFFSCSPFSQISKI